MTDLTDVSGELLEDVRVLELSTSIAGAYAGRMLRLLGASVARWEAPTMADCLPEVAGFLAESLHQDKEVVPLVDLGDSERLGADIVIVDVLHDDAFDGEWTARARPLVTRLGPRVTIVDLSMFAEHLQTRPARASEFAHEPGTALTASAVSATSWGIGHPGMAPLSLPFDLAEYLVATEGAAVAALSALLGTTSDGDGRYWSLSASDVLASCTGQVCSVFLPFGRPWARDGARASQSGGFYPGAMFPCRDGQVTVVCRTDREWVGLRRAMGDPAWSQEERFADARIVARDHAAEADLHLSAWVADHTCDEMTALGRVHGFAVAAVLTPAQGAALEQFETQRFIEPDSSGRADIPGRPWRVVEAPTSGPERKPLELRPTATKPLAGLKVLDLSWVWSGPMLTAQLADLGAEVLKVEGRTRPDPTRSRGRALRDGRPIDGPDLEVSTYFGQMNRGKRSLAINIATGEGAELVRELACQADVVVENMRPGALDRRGLGYRDLSALNPDLVMLSMSMMGQVGPMRDLGGYAPVMSGLAGLDSVIGYDESDLIGLFNSSLGDPNGAAHATAVLLAALARRQRTGHGCWVDVSQIGCLLATTRAALVEEVHLGRRRVPANTHAVFWPHGAYRCAGDDEWIAVAARTDDERRRLGDLLGTELGAREQGEAALARWARDRDPDLALAALREARIPAAHVDTFERMVNREWTKSRRLSGTLEHPYLGAQTVFFIPWKADGEAFGSEQPAPLLGSSTEEILIGRLGRSGARIEELKEGGVLE